MCRVNSESFVLPFINSPIVNTIVSLISTSLSSRSLVEIEIKADFESAGITIESLLIVNSSLIVAVPEMVSGTIISFPEISEDVAISLTSLSEFSSISSELSDKIIFSGSSSSFIVTE